MDLEALRALYPGLTGDELRIASENLDAYLELAWEIFEDIRAQAAPVDRDPVQL